MTVYTQGIFFFWKKWRGQAAPKCVSAPALEIAVPLFEEIQCL